VLFEEVDDAEMEVFTDDGWRNLTWIAHGRHPLLTGCLLTNAPM